MSREMKDSGIPWIGEIPKDWKIEPFKFNASIHNGSDYKHIVAEKGYPVLGSGGVFAYAKKYLHDGEAVLLGRKGTVDKPLFIKGKFWTVDTMFYATTYKHYCSKFLYYQAINFPFQYYSCSTALPSMKASDFLSHKLVVPSHKEQKAIAEFLDRKCGEIDELISIQERMVEELKAYKQSVTTETVTKGLNPNAPIKDSGIDWIGQIPEHWKVSKIKNEINIMDYLRQPISAEKRINELGLYDYYGASGVIDKIDEYNINDKVLLIGEDGANLIFRNLPLIYKAQGKFWVNNHAHILKVKSSNDYEYMFYMLEAGDYFLYITGSAQPKLSQENLKNFVIPVPPLSEQQQIADYLDKKCSEIDSLIDLKQQKIKELKDYKKSIIYEYVTGKKQCRDMPLACDNYKFTLSYVPKACDNC